MAKIKGLARLILKIIKPVCRSRTQEDPDHPDSDNLN
jgi:hypothetical protein